MFLEAPRTEAEMAQFCRSVDVPTLANLIEGGLTPTLPPERLAALGYKIVAHPLTLVSAAVAAMKHALNALKQGIAPPPSVSFDELRETVGWTEYDREAARYG